MKGMKEDVNRCKEEFIKEFIKAEVDKIQGFVLSLDFTQISSLHQEE